MKQKSQKKAEKEEQLEAERREIKEFEYRGHTFVPVPVYLEEGWTISCKACSRECENGMEGCEHDSRYPGIPIGEGLKIHPLKKIPEKFKEIAKKYGDKEVE